MSVFASGAIKPGEALEYIKSISGIEAVVFGASSRGHILETTKLINEALT